MDLNTEVKGMHHCKPNGLHDLAKHVVVNFDSGTSWCNVHVPLGIVESEVRLADQTFDLNNDMSSAAVC